MSNREIKFRVWNLRTKSFENPSDFAVVGDSTLMVHYGHGEWGNIYDGDKASEVFIVQQYTGFKDSNNVEIYEGDIIENANGKGPVVFQNGSYRIHMIANPNKQTVIMGALYWETIIGNIFETPELL